MFFLTALIAFYRGRGSGAAIGNANDPYVLSLFRRFWHEHDAGARTKEALAAAVLADKKLWGEDLGRVPGLTKTVNRFLQRILAKGMPQALEALLQ